MSDTAVAGLILGLTYLAIASERVNRTAAALGGAVAMIVVKLDGFDQAAAFSSIDFNVIFLLMGMMIQVSVLSRTGVFEWLATHAAAMAHGSPVRILIALSLATAVLSAVLDNVTTVVLIAPVTISVASALRMRATPLLISEAIASNIGGSATLIGDPPNIVIGSAADLGFLSFLTNVAPIIVLILIIYLLAAPRLFSLHRYETRLRRERVEQMEEKTVIRDPALLRLSCGILALTIVGFGLHSALGYQPATVALLGAALILLLSRQNVQNVLLDVEWSTLLFFVGLFIVIGGTESVGILSDVGERVNDMTNGNVSAASIGILWFSAFASGIVDNIPYTTAMLPVVREVGTSVGGGGGPGDVLWWSLSLGACLGGNLTLIAASANVLVANLAGRKGQRIGFWEFFRYGAPVTVLSVAVSAVYLWLRYLLF
ncbi:MAG TPA: ArsB/NhaD family transporter [Dehalococcoidia bacterium]|nr:ArsB/NhaD family transporter [Dehalococcoidia bacterium]